MRRPTTALLALAAAALPGAPALAHHSQAMFDMSQGAVTDIRLRLRCEITVEDPMYLEEPATLTMRWDHRTDLEFSPAAEACDAEVAERYLGH